MQKDFINGVIDHPDSIRKTDYLYRISIKGVILSDNGQVLVVKESGRNFWDLPGGGMDHGETLKQGIAREMFEEVSLVGDFDYRIIAVEDPMYLENSHILQVRLIFHVIPESMQFKPGEDADEVKFVDIKELSAPKSFSESMVYKYAQLASLW